MLLLLTLLLLPRLHCERAAEVYLHARRFGWQRESGVWRVREYRLRAAMRAATSRDLRTPVGAHNAPGTALAQRGAREAQKSRGVRGIHSPARTQTRTSRAWLAAGSKQLREADTYEGFKCVVFTSARQHFNARQNRAGGALYARAHIQGPRARRCISLGAARRAHIM